MGLEGLRRNQEADGWRSRGASFPRLPADAEEKRRGQREARALRSTAFESNFSQVPPGGLGAVHSKTRQGPFVQFRITHSILIEFNV